MNNYAPLGERYVYKFVCDPEALFQMSTADPHRAMKVEPGEPSGRQGPQYCHVINQVRCLSVGSLPNNMNCIIGVLKPPCSPAGVPGILPQLSDFWGGGGASTAGAGEDSHHWLLCHLQPGSEAAICTGTVWTALEMVVTFPAQYYRQLAPLQDRVADNATAGSQTPLAGQDCRTIGRQRGVGSQPVTESQVGWYTQGRPGCDKMFYIGQP